MVYPSFDYSEDEKKIDGIRRGRVFISYQKTGPLPYPSVPGTSALPEDTIRIREQRALPVRVRIVGGKDMSFGWYGRTARRRYQSTGPLPR